MELLFFFFLLFFDASQIHCLAGGTDWSSAVPRNPESFALSFGFVVSELVLFKSPTGARKLEL